MHRLHYRSALLALAAVVAAACSEAPPLAPDAASPSPASFGKGNGSPPDKGGGGGGGGDDSGGGLIDPTLAFERSGKSSANLFLANADGSGASELLSIKFGGSLKYSFDPQGNAIAYTHSGALERLEYEVTDGTLTVTNTFPLGRCFNPRYSPDGSEIACMGPNYDENRNEVQILGRDGNLIRVLYAVPESHYVRDIAWNPSGSEVLFLEEDAADHGFIVSAAVDGSGMQTAFSDPAIDIFSFGAARKSDLLAVATQDEALYLVDGGTATALTSGTEPAFSPDDSSIYYTGPGGKEIMRIDVATGVSTVLTKGFGPEVRR